MNKTRVFFISAAMVATMIALLADSVCPGTLKGLNVYLLYAMYVVIAFVCVKAKE